MKRIYLATSNDANPTRARIRERLIARYGARAVVDGPRADKSDSSHDAIPRALRGSVALLVCIDPAWLDARDSAGRRILDAADSRARIELETAVRRHIPIIPVLLDGASLPAADALPESLRTAFVGDVRRAGGNKPESLRSVIARTGVPVRPDPDFGADFDRLIAALDVVSGAEDRSDAERRAVRNVGMLLGLLLTLHGLGLGLAPLVFLSRAPEPSQAIATSTDPALTNYFVFALLVSLIFNLALYLLAGLAAGFRTGRATDGLQAALLGEFIGVVLGEICLGAVAVAGIGLSTLVTTVRSGGTLAPSQALYAFILELYAAVLIIPFGLGLAALLGLLGGGLGASGNALIQARRAAAYQHALAKSTTASWTAAAHPRRAATDGQPASVAQSKRLRQSRRAERAKVFISYRRADSAIMCGLIFDRLVTIFGREAVFKDVDSIPFGANFASYIDDVLDACAAQVVVIGPGWLDAVDGMGQHRLDAPDDFVRLEVETALRQGIPVVPVLVHGASLPPAERLPEALRPLAALTPLTVGDGDSLSADLDRVAGALATVMPTSYPAIRRQLLSPVVTGLAFGTVLSLQGLVIAAAMVRWWGQKPLPYDENSLVSISRSNAYDHPVVLISLLVSIAAYLLAGIVAGLWSGRGAKGVQASLFAESLGLLVGGACIAFTVTHHTVDLNTIQGTAINAVVFDLVVGAPFGIIASALLGGLGGTIGAAIRSPRGRKLSRAPDASAAHRGGTVLLSYRPEDEAVAGNVRSALAAYFGPRVVQDAATRASDWPAALVVLVGAQWSESSPSGQPSRLYEPHDPVRLQIEAALANGVPVLPVYLADANPPPPDRLPPSVQDFHLLNGLHVREGGDFAADVVRLRASLEATTSVRESARRRARRRAGDIGVWIAATTGGFVFLGGISLGFITFVYGILRGPETHNSQIPGQFNVWMAATLIASIVVPLMVGMIVTRRTGRLASSIVGATMASTAVDMALAIALGATTVIFNSYWSNPTSTDLRGTVVETSILAALALAGGGLVGGPALGWLGALLGRVWHRRAHRRTQARDVTARVSAFARSST